METESGIRVLREGDLADARRVALLAILDAVQEFAEAGATSDAVNAAVRLCDLNTLERALGGHLAGPAPETPWVGVLDAACVEHLRAAAERVEAACIELSAEGTNPAVNQSDAAAARAILLRLEQLEGLEDDRLG